MRINHFIAALRQHLDVKLGKNHKNYDIEMGSNRKEKDEEDVKNIVEGIHSWSPNLWSPNQAIVKLNNGMIADNKMVCNILNSKQKRVEIFDEFVSRYTLESNNVSNLQCNDPIKKIHLNLQKTK